MPGRSLILPKKLNDKSVSTWSISLPGAMIDCCRSRLVVRSLKNPSLEGGENLMIKREMIRVQVQLDTIPPFASNGKSSTNEFILPIIPSYEVTIRDRQSSSLPTDCAPPPSVQATFAGRPNRVSEPDPCRNVVAVYQVDRPTVPALGQDLRD